MVVAPNFYIAFSSSFWIIPREGTEALLVILMLICALKQSGRERSIHIIYKNCIAALIAGLLVAIACVWLHSIFTGQARELSEAFASLIALSMLLFVNFDTFTKHAGLMQMSIASLGFMAFISVFRELAEVILFYYGLFQGDFLQQVGTFAGLMIGCLLLVGILYAYKVSTTRWKMINTIVFNITPIFILLLAIMCIGNAITAFQEARWLGFTPIQHMYNNNLLYVQASKEYCLAVGIFFACTGPLFLNQFLKSAIMLVQWLRRYIGGRYLLANDTHLAVSKHEG